MDVVFLKDQEDNVKEPFPEGRAEVGIALGALLIGLEVLFHVKVKQKRIKIDCLSNYSIDIPIYSFLYKIIQMYF